MDKSQRPGSKNRILSKEQVDRVNEYSLRVLEEIGCKVLCDEALDILGRIGCDVSRPERVRIPRGLVMEAIEAAPKTIEVFNRDGEKAMTFAEDSCYYGTGSDCPTTIDLYSGERRPCTKQDVGRLARFCDGLANIDFVMSFGIANDVPQGESFVHQYEAMLLNTKKPVIVTGHGRNDMTTIIEMGAAAAGGLDRLEERPHLILYTEPVSPLVHTEMGVGKGLVCCDHGIPFIYIGSPMMGATGPATLEGILVQTVAESLSGLVIFQGKKPGAKFIFGGDATCMDMRTTLFSYGAPELNILNAALADMAHFYGLPFFCLAGASDAKVLDAQAGLEYAMSIYNATLNGCNIIHDCGYLESGLTSSFESVLFADEIIGMVKHMLRPLRFDGETVPLELMDRVGPGGNFLMEDHTLANFKRTFWFPRFLDRNVHETWQQEGSKDLRTVLGERARAIFEAHSPPVPSEEVVRSIRNIVAAHKPDVHAS
ncbi:MAG: trimethylamine methyltransferase family protein [Deltaproteobacteria bacterium]|nr:trimethylamine methyltransferase family protein [Deltaproteobacteria bacterium]MBW2121880.1 trimethylamine methyltransferase family protein [Deltaproteobacteria bacterium]